MNVEMDELVEGAFARSDKATNGIERGTQECVAVCSREEIAGNFRDCAIALIREANSERQRRRRGFGWNCFDLGPLEGDTLVATRSFEKLLQFFHASDRSSGLCDTIFLPHSKS